MPSSLLLHSNAAQIHPSRSDRDIALIGPSDQLSIRSGPIRRTTSLWVLVGVCEAACMNGPQVDSVFGQVPTTLLRMSIDGNAFENPCTHSLAGWLASWKKRGVIGCMVAELLKPYRHYAGPMTQPPAHSKLRSRQASSLALHLPTHLSLCSSNDTYVYQQL